MRIFYLGSLTTPVECRKNPYCSEAANNAQLDMLRALICHGVKQVIAVCPTVMPSFPKSNCLWVSSSAHKINSSLQVIAPSFVNFGSIRVFTQFISIFKCLQDLRNNHGKPDVILSYNLSTGYALAGFLLAKLWRIPMVPIVADLGFPEMFRTMNRRCEARLQIALLKNMSGVISFSSRTAQDLCLDQPVIKIEPGVNADDFQSQPSYQRTHNNRKIVMFSGTLAEESGLLMLLNAFSLVKDPDIELWITGRGILKEEIEKISKYDSRIRFLGFVEREELLKLYALATVLINPRPSCLPEHRYNFPSKLLQYMATGRPVITTATGDVQDYESLVFLLRVETESAMAQLISDVCSLSDDDLNAKAMRARDYVLQHKTWNIEGLRILDFLSSLVLKLPDRHAMGKLTALK